ncbi:hypothetical protein ACQE2J_02700 [Brevibacterium sp. LE-L]|uniref:hypothetical protein n=1 Tax=Brevibacterium sp. LE-L TaxID=3418557 RepID=UPI003CEA6EA2
MKKIILAPAVALAFTGLVASPVAAAESPSTQSASTKAEQQKQDEAEQAKKEEAKKAAAEKEAAEKKAEEKAEEKAAAEKKAKDAKKAEEKKKAAEDKADKDKADKKNDAKKPPKKVDPKPAPAPEDEDKDAKDDDKAEDTVNPINASVQVVSNDVTAEELHEDGVTVKVTGLEKGDKVSVKSGLTGPATTAQGSTATLKLHSAKEVTQDSVAFALQVQRTGTTSITESSNVDVEVNPQAVAPKVSLSTDKISESDFAKNGIKVTGEGFTPDGKVTVVGGTAQSPFATLEVDADEEGKISAILKFDGDDNLPAGDYSVWGVDQETETSSDAQSFTITEDSEIDPTVKIDSKKISLEDFKKDGLKFSGSGFSPNGTITVQGETVTPQRAAAPQAEELRADEDGNVEGAVIAPESLEAGTYALTFVDDETEETSDPVEITVTDDEDAVDPIDASLKVDPKEITAEDLANKDKGVTVTVSGVKKGDKIKDSLTGETETAEADGDYKLHLWYEGNPKNLEAGKVPFTVTIDREGTESETLNGNINVVEDETEAPAEATFKVSPKTIEAADFANEKKGVTLAVENCEPGADVHFEVTPKGINVTAYENIVKADDEGNASVNVFGTSTNTSAYVGSYTATATCGDDTMKDTFKVTQGANGGGDDGNGGDNGNAGNAGSQLPRTGADLGGLTTGALLVLVGGAAIALTGRKNKFGQTPTSF